MLSHLSCRQKLLRNCLISLWRHHKKPDLSVCTQIYSKGCLKDRQVATCKCCWCSVGFCSVAADMYSSRDRGWGSGANVNGSQVDMGSFDVNLALLELLETPEAEGKTVKSASFRLVCETLKGALGTGRSVADQALVRLMGKAANRRDIDDVFDVLRANRLRRYELGQRVPYTYTMSGELYDRAISVAGERYVVENLSRFQEEELPLARWRLRPLFKYCAFERPGHVIKIWDYAKTTNLKKELGAEAVSILRVYLDNDMLKEAKIFRDYEIKAHKVRLSGSEGMRKSIYFAIDEKARWVKSKSYVKKKGLDRATGQKLRQTLSITPEEHKVQPAWMDFARRR